MALIRMISLRRKIAVGLQVFGIVSCAIGAGLAHIAAGLIVGGVGSVLFGVALERDNGISESVQ